jgi:hypothetical protein
MKKLTILTAILITSMSFAQVPNYVPTNGLVGWWPFNGNSNDESGNGNNGTVNGAALTADRFGNANSAYSFDGVDDYIQTNYTGISGSNSRSFSLWYFTNAFGPSQTLLSYGLDDIPSNYINFNTSSSCTGIGLDISYSFKDYDNSVSIGQWNHYLIIIDSQIGTDLNNVMLYKDGSLLTTLCSSYGLNTQINTLLQYSMTFGKYHAQSIDFLNGKIDDIGIWNRALTDCEIKNLYNAHLGPVNLNAGTNQTVCNGDNITLTATGATTYTWDNNVINGQAFAPTSTQDYIVTGIDSLGCTGTDTVSVVVLESSSATQTETALDTYTWPVNNQTYTQSGTYADTLVNTAGCDSIVTLNLTLSFTGINELNTTNLTISPNPTAGDFTIAGLELYNNISSMHVSDVNGKLVKELDLTASKFTLGTVKPGVYFVTITAGNKQEVIKLIKD